MSTTNNTHIVACWHPWEKKISFHCPACDKKLSLKNPLLPIASACPKCGHNCTITNATYPIWHAVGFGLLTLFMSVLNIPRFIGFVILAMLVTLFLFTDSKRRFKLPALSYLVGTLVAAGWMVTVPCGILLFLVDEKVKEHQKVLQRKQIQENIQRLPRQYDVSQRQNSLPVGSKQFDKITIPKDVFPKSISLSPTMRSKVGEMKVYTVEFAGTAKKIAFTNINFDSINLDNEIVDANKEAAIDTFAALFQAGYSINKSNLNHPFLKGNKFSIKGFVSGTSAKYECFQFYNRNSIWWINFIGSGDDLELSEFANNFMSQVCFTLD